MSWLALSIQPKSGRPSASTKSGTTTTTASADGIASAYSVVARSSPAGTRRARYSSRWSSPGNGARPALMVSTVVGVDVDADDLVAAVGELRRERKADLAQADDCDLHDVISSETWMVRDSRADCRQASATRTVSMPSRIVMTSVVVPEDGVAEVLVLDPQRLRLGDREAGDVALADAPEGLHLVPLGEDLAVLVEGEVAVQRVGDERAALAR